MFDVRGSLTSCSRLVKLKDSSSGTIIASAAIVGPEVAHRIHFLRQTLPLVALLRNVI